MQRNNKCLTKYKLPLMHFPRHFNVNSTWACGKGTWNFLTSSLSFCLSTVWSFLCFSDNLDCSVWDSLQSHSGVFPCNGCGRTYKHKGNLDRHQQFECGKIPQFTCPYCQYQSKQRSNLKRHVQIWHDSSFV